MNEFIAKISQEDSDTLLRLYKKIRVLNRIRQIKFEQKEDISVLDKCNLRNAEMEIETYWTILADKYNLKKSTNGKWTIDFYRNEIFIIY